MQRSGLSALLFCSSKSRATKSDHERLNELQQQIDVLKNELTDTVDVSVNVLDQRISDLEITLRLHLQTVFQAVQACQNPNPGGAARAGAVDTENELALPDLVLPGSADRAGAVDGILIEEDQEAPRGRIILQVCHSPGDYINYIDQICTRDITKRNFNRTDSFVCADFVELVKHHSQQLNFAPICEDGVTTWQCLVCLCRVDSTRNMIIHCRGKRHRCELIKFKGDQVMRESDWARLEASCRCLGQFWR